MDFSWDFSSRRFSLRQHGTLSLLQVVFRPTGRKTTCKELKMLGKRKSFFISAGWLIKQISIRL
jgi:hypothetical protein